jgi:hypothetical protein
MLVHNSFISCNFNYCPVVWMFSSKTNLDKLEKAHKRALRFVTNDHSATYLELCKKEKQLNIQMRCIKSVAIQMYKVRKKTAPEYIREIFDTRENPYNLRDNDSFDLPQFNTITYGRKSFKYYGAKLWTNIPTEIKQSVSLSTFKRKIEIWLLNLLENENNLTIEFL